MDWNAPPAEELDPPKEPLHPAGTFPAVVTNAVADTTKNGKPMLKLTFKTSEGKVHGRLVYSPENPTAKRMWFKQLSNLGLVKEFFDAGPELDDVAFTCVKAEVLIRVTHREYEGNDFADVAYIDALPEAA